MNLSQHIPRLHTVGKPWSAPWSTAPYLRASLQEQSKTAFAQTGEQSSAAAVGKRQRGANVAGCEQVVRGKPRLHSNGWCCLLYKCHSRAKKVGLVSTAAVLLDLKIDRFIIYIKGSGCSEKWGLIGFCWHWWFQSTSHWWSCGGICEAWRRWKLRCDCVSKFTLKEIVFWC